MRMTQEELLATCKAVLQKNNRGNWTIPAGGLYPHQWLWDSCFIAIGLRHYDVDRAQQELISLLRGQWSNGMLPNMILTQGILKQHSPEFWRSHVSPYSPDDVPTSGITQPPMLAEAIVRVGEKLTKTERRSFYQRMYPGLLAYHNWLYNERDPRKEGLVTLVHPWESGLDNTPPWMHQMHSHALPLWVRIIDRTGLDNLVTFVRKDTRYALPGERLSNVDSLTLYSLQRKLRRLHYDNSRVLKKAPFALQDIVFNSIFMRANYLLLEIANTIKQKVPDDLMQNIKRSEEAFDKFWEAYNGQYYSRSFETGKLVRVGSIGTLMPLYAGIVTEERAELLVRHLHDKNMFGSQFPVATTPLNSSYFHPHTYWQGPAWINTNWLVADGLRRYGYKDEANWIIKQSLELVSKHGCEEYFSPIDGSPAGVKNFSWTAALTIDFLNQA